MSVCTCHKEGNGTWVCASCFAPPSIKTIAERVRKMAAEMKDVAVLMDYYGGFPFQRHADELLGASLIAESWAAEMEEE